MIHWYACGSDGRTDESSGYGLVSTKFYWMERLQNFFKYGALCSTTNCVRAIHTEQVKLI